jgi:hypothetical protein
MSRPVLEVGKAHFAEFRNPQPQTGAEDEIPLEVVVLLGDGVPGLVEHRPAAEGGDREAAAEVGLGADAVHLLDGHALVDGEAAGLEAGVGLLEAVADVAVGQLAGGLAFRQGLVGQVGPAPAEEVEGQAVPAHVGDIEAEELGGRGEGGLVEARRVLLPHLGDGGAVQAEVLGPARRGSQRRDEDRLGAQLHGVPPLANRPSGAASMTRNRLCMRNLPRKNRH